MIWILKKRNHPYVMIGREILENPHLSFQAKGMMCYLLSRPRDWKVRPDQLVSVGPNRWAAIYSALGELRDAGYARIRVVREKGKIVTKDWIISEDPALLKGLDLEKLDQGKLDQGKLDQGKLDQGKLDQGKLDQGNPDRCTLLRKVHTNKGSDASASLAPQGLDAPRLLGKPPSLSNGGLPSLSDREEPINDIVRKFSELTVKHRLHVGRRGATKNGWSPVTLAKWRQEALRLLTQVGDSKRVIEVIEWYSHHLRDPWVKTCVTFQSFSANFLSIEKAMMRQMGETVASPSRIRVISQPGEMPDDETDSD